MAFVPAAPASGHPWACLPSHHLRYCYCLLDRCRCRYMKCHTDINWYHFHVSVSIDARSNRIEKRCRSAIVILGLFPSRGPPLTRATIDILYFYWWNSFRKDRAPQSKIVVLYLLCCNTVVIVCLGVWGCPSGY